jgi:CRISPR-associated protein Csb1
LKTDRVDPTGDPKPDFGMVPFHRTEFVAEAITAYFNLDLALLRGYGLPDEAIDLLIALALFKVRRFLAHGLRLRTACDLEVICDIHVTRPAEFRVPDIEALSKAMPHYIATCKKWFADPPVTNVTVIYEKKSRNDKKSAEEQGEKTAQSDLTEGKD